MNKTEFLAIVDKYLNGSSTIEEERLLRNYYDSFQKTSYWEEAELGPIEIAEEKMLQRLKEAWQENRTPPVYKLQPAKRYTWVAAAAIFLLLCGVAYKWGNHESKGQVAVKKERIREKTANDLPPGGNKALLTFSDGSSIALDSAKNGKLSQQGNINIIKLNAGELTYDATSSAHHDVVYNTITTPKGGQYQVRLADGTQVWLNAASSLHFPTSFTGRERDVEITGEVYFEVAKNKDMPFKVKVHGMEVEVLGTHFNVNAYDDEASVKTTLLEGSVKISNHKGSSLLKPGQQAAMDRTNGEVYVKTDADIDEAVAWKDGRFQFNDADIPSIMRQVARWYNVEISYEGNIPSDHFTGKVARNADASSVLKILSLSDEHFRIEGKNIIVTSK